MKKLKYLSIFFVCTLSQFAFASPLEWNDLGMAKTYSLRQEINFQGKIIIPAGEKFEMQDYISQDFFSYFEMHALECDDPTLTSEMILVTPEASDQSSDQSVGVKIQEDCNIGVWVETKDLNSPSLFE